MPWLRVDFQVQSIPDRLVAKIFGGQASVGPVVTIEPRRRKFHRPVTLTLPLPPSLTDNDATAGSPPKSGTAKRDVDLANLRLLCSLNGAHNSRILYTFSSTQCFFNVNQINQELNK